MAEITTKEQFRDRMSWLYKRIGDEQKKIQDSPGLSAESTTALTSRADLVQEFVRTQIEGQKKFGSYGLDKKGNPAVVYDVPKTMTDLLARFDNPKTKLTAAELAAPLVGNINLGTTGQTDNPGFYQLKVTPAQLKAVDKIGAGGPIGPITSDTTVTTTGPTGPTVSGNTTKVGATKMIKGVLNTWDGKKWIPEKKKVVVDWKPKFREMFAKQSWLLDLDPVKYSGLFKLLETGVKDQMWLTPESQERFAAQLDNTDFFTELKNEGTVKNITSLVGDLGFDKTDFNVFLKDAMNFGWKGETLKQKVYEEAFRKDPATGNYVNTTTIERVRKSSPYLSVANIGKSFFNTVSDSTIAGVLTGSMVTDDVVRQQRELAKGKYGHLSSLIDQGLSLEDISDSYKTQASKVLEKDLNSIDMSQGAYSTAFDFGEEGKKRLMSTSEWEVKLRSDANFGWDKTQNAKEEARALASSISQAFGRVL